VTAYNTVIQRGTQVFGAMPAQLLKTKLYIPAARPGGVIRLRLIECLNIGLHRTLTLISAPAGFGKTALVSEWITRCELPAAWLSLNEEDSDPQRFLTYFIAALQTLQAGLGQDILTALHAPQPPPTETLLTALLNEITAIGQDTVLVLDDYHSIASPATDHALAFIIEHLPPQMHLFITTRTDPQLPLARMRARAQLVELRAADLRFTTAETALFLTRTMGLALSPAEIAALEHRTEGWIAGLQLAAISLQGRTDTGQFIASFTGSNSFILDYLFEEVLRRQPDAIQTFLLQTSILERMSGPLCDALLALPAGSGQTMVEHLDRANLFIVPLDNERRWYRYHHLFADLLRQHLLKQTGILQPRLHLRASQWYEDNGFDLDAFHHAVAAQDIDRSARLAEGNGMPLIFRGAIIPVQHWLNSLTPAEMDARPSLWVMSASIPLFNSQINGVEERLKAAEAALAGVDITDMNERTRDLIGHIASIRATLAVAHSQIETIVTQSQRALEYLSPHNLPVRTATTWSLGFARLQQGDRTAARLAFTEACATSTAIGHFIMTIMCYAGLGELDELDNQLLPAIQNYQHALKLTGEPPMPIACEGYLGLARIAYQQNDLELAAQHAQKSIQLARQIENTNWFIGGELIVARLKLAHGDVTGAYAAFSTLDRLARQRDVSNRVAEIAAALVPVLLRLNRVEEAEQIAWAHDLPVERARVQLARGDAEAAFSLLTQTKTRMAAKGWAYEHLKALIVSALAARAYGRGDLAVQLLGDALALAEPGGFIRVFIDEGGPMATLLADAAARGAQPEYTKTLLSAFAEQAPNYSFSGQRGEPLPERLSQRELAILRMIDQGLSNSEIGQRLFLALSTVKGHNQNIFAKLQVKRRTEALARARELGLL
jgi:LuxR family maltose regulon positive regulatory protein